MRPDPVLLVGGAGALGRALIQRWPAELQPPIVWDIALLGPAAGTCVDLKDPRAVAQAAERLPEKIHMVHLAARLEVSVQPDNVRESILNNVAALVVPTCALATRISTLTQVSSVSIYNSETPSPLPEAALPAPRSAYGAGKAAAEVAGTALARMWHWRHCIIRPTQLFGLPSADQSLPHVLMDRGVAGKPLRLSADRGTLRDYLHVDDAVAIIREQCREPREGIYNLGSGSPVSLGDLFDTACKRWSVPLEVANTCASRADQYLDMTRTREAFSIAPGTTVLDWLANAQPPTDFVASF